MNSDINQFIRAIHREPTRLVLVMAGAGTSALCQLLKIGGASATLLEAVVPYHEKAFADFYGELPEKYVSKDTAHKLAGRAFCRAQKIGGGTQNSIGLACTATIATNRPKRGLHEAHLTYWSAEKIVHQALTLQKGFRSREEEEILVGRLVLNLLAEAAHLTDRLPLALERQERIKRSEFNLADQAHQLNENDLVYFGITAHGRPLSGMPKAILSGAFNPLHAGHTGLAQAASELLQTEVAFECAANNVDKPSLSPTTILSRLAQFAGYWTVLASNMPTFVEKSRTYQGVVFVVGFDTAVRILDPLYYHNSLHQRDAALAEIAENDCRFLVAGRADKDGDFKQLADLDIPRKFKGMFHPIPASKFRLDISSTTLRSEANHSNISEHTEK